MSLRDEKKKQTHLALLDAALNLSIEYGTFSRLSLREISQHIGLVPTAFYRHFRDLDALALELVDRVSLHLHAVYHHLRKMTIENPLLGRRDRLNYFFDDINEHVEFWHFFLIERYAGSPSIRQAIQREIQFLLDAMKKDLQSLPHFLNLNHPDKILAFAELFLNTTFYWAHCYLELKRQYPVTDFTPQRHQLSDAAEQHIEMLYQGLKQ